MNTIQTEVFGLDSRITPFLQKFGLKSVSFLGEEIMQYNVIDYGAVADGEKLNTVAVQAAIDACAAAGGGQVFFPKGKYVLSTVFLKSNVHIVFEDATEILGSLNFTDYCPDETVDYPLYQDKSHSYFHCSMFVGIDCENIKLTGKAKIDMD
jgi:polygalacturonase